MTTITFEGAHVLLPDQIAPMRVTVEDGIIAALDGAARGRVIDARGLILAPALIDVHGDAFERQLMPRPGVFFPLETALLETDRQLAANGIATAYHALTLGFEPGLRSVARGREMIDGLRALAPRLSVDNRVQLRWETFAFEALGLIEETLADPRRPALAFNDHLSMAMRAGDVAVQERLYEHDPDFETLSLEDDALMRARHGAHAKRAGLDWPDYHALLREVWARRPQVPQVMADLAAKARAQGVPMLSHDDTRARTRESYRALGACVSEFPMTMEAVEAARAGGDALIFGAPNALRGGSHLGSLSAAARVQAGQCDALASDYYYPALLAAVARLQKDTGLARHVLWQLVSAGPARIMRLDDRGEIAAGKRADLVLVDWPEGQAPAIRGTWVAGRCAYRSQPEG